MPSLFVGVDLGTSATKAILISHSEEVVSQSSWPLDDLRADRVFGELDATEILSSVEGAVRWGRKMADELGATVAGLGLAVQRSGVVAWRGGEPLSPVLSWRVGRDEERVAEVRADVALSARITERTGLVPNPFFAGTKVGWLQRKFPDHAVKVGTLDALVVSRLVDAQSFVTDDSMASRTLLYDLEEGRWSEELCGVWRVDSARLPQIVPSVCQRRGTIDGVPVIVSIGDKEAATVVAIRQGGGGVAALDLGTLATLTVARAELPDSQVGISRGVLYSTEDPSGERRRVYQQEIRSSIVGDVLDWVRARVGSELSFDELVAFWEGGQKHDGVIFSLPRTGSGMVATAGGDEGPCFEGLSSEPEHLVRAALEHIVFSISEMVVMARAHGLIAGDQRVIVSGRLVRMPGLLEILARISGVAIGVSDRPADDGIESSSALGAAVLAVDRIRGKDRSEVHPSAQRAVQWINPDIGPRNVALEDRYRRWIGLRDRVVLRSE
jgi:glycerol kinase